MPEILVVDSIDQMRMTSPATATLVWVERYRVEHPGGGGFLRWDANLPLPLPPVNDGTVFASTTDPTAGRWIRDQVRDALDFGANPTADYTSLDPLKDSSGALRQYMKWALSSDDPARPTQEVILPKGVFYLLTLNLPPINKRLIIRGAGMQNTILVVEPSLMTGDVFQVQDTWRESYNLADNTAYPDTADQGVTIRDMSIISKATSATVNCGARAIVTKGRVDELRVFNVQFAWLRTALSLGVESIGAAPAMIRESSFFNVHALHCGFMDSNRLPQNGAIDIGLGTSTALEDGTHDLSFEQCSIVYPEAWGGRIRNVNALQKITRVRFVNFMLHGSSQKTTAPPKAPVMVIAGNVDNVDLISVGMNGSTKDGSTLYGCVELNVAGGVSPDNITILGDIRTCNGVGIDVVKCNGLNAVLTVQQSSIGAEEGVDEGDNPAVRFGVDSVLPTASIAAGARIRAISTFGGGVPPASDNPNPGAKIEVDESVQPYVLVERSSGDITGMHMQRVVSASTTMAFYDETILVDTETAPPGVPVTITLPRLADLNPGQGFYVMDGAGKSATDNIAITVQVDTADTGTMEGGSTEAFTVDWGKRAFRCVEVLNNTAMEYEKRWLKWVP
jgi:hypothetical protein